MSAQRKEIIGSFINYIKKDLNIPTEVIEGLKKSYKINMDNQKTYPLTKVWEEGIKTVQPDLEPKLQEFINLLSDKGYFKGADTPEEYNNRLEKAKEKYAQRTQQAKAQAEKLKGIGNGYMKEGKYDDAIESYKQAINLCPKNPIYFSNLAAAYLGKKQVDDAIDACKKAIEVDPSFARAHTRLGNAYEKKGDTQKAVAAYQAGLRADPNNQKCKQRIEELGGTVQETQPQQPPQMPSMPGMPGMGGPGGMPDMSQMFSQMGQMFGGQGGQAPDFEGLMNNPQIQDMVQNIYNNPQMRQFAEGMMKNMGLDADSIQQKIVAKLENDEEVQNSPKLKKFLEELKTDGPEAARRYKDDEEITGLMKRVMADSFPEMSGMFNQ